MQHGQKKDKFFLPFSLRQFSVFSLSQQWDVIDGFGPFLWSLYSLITGCGWTYSLDSGRIVPVAVSPRPEKQQPACFFISFLS